MLKFEFKVVKNKLLLFLSILSLSYLVDAQERKQIEIEYAPYMTFEEEKPDATILTRDNSDQVHIKHEGIEMWCNEAVYYARKILLRPMAMLESNKATVSI